MSFIKKLSFVFFLFILATFKVDGQNKKDTICIIQINDVYEISALNGGHVGGMARVSSLVKNSRTSYPDTYVLLAGDFLSPSVFGTTFFEGERLSGRQMVDVLNSVGVDYVTFGNHEFDVSSSTLQKRIDESKFKWFSTNVMRKDSLVNSFYKNQGTTKEYFPKTIQLVSKSKKLKVGIFAVTLPANKQPFVMYNDIDSTIQSVLPDLKKQNDIVIGLTHLAYTEDSAILAKYSDIKLIVGGHEHQNMFVKSGSGAVSKADANAKTAYRHLIYRDRRGKISIKSDIISLNDSITEDAETKTVVKKWEDIATNSFRLQGLDPYAHVCELKEKLLGTEASIRYTQNNLGHVIASSLLSNNQVDGSFINSGSIRIDDDLSGTLTQMDIIRVLPFGGHVVNVKMKGSLLKKILDNNDLNKGLGGYLQYGKSFRKDSNNWYVGENILNDNKLYTISTIEFLVSGREQKMEFFNNRNPDILAIEKINDQSGNPVDIRQMLIKYLSPK